MHKKQLRLEAFNKIFNEFLNDLNILQPNDSSLILVKAAVSIIDTETLVQQFMEYLEEYTEKILLKDESFFITELPKNLDKDSFAAKEINRVTEIWLDPQTKDDDKECIWKYFICLIKLGKSILN